MNRRTLFRALLAAPLALLGKRLPEPETELRIHFNHCSFASAAKHGRAADAFQRVVMVGTPLGNGGVWLPPA